MLPASALFAWVQVISIGCILLLCVHFIFGMQVSGMSYFHKILGKDVLLKPAQKFNMFQCHYFLLVAIMIIFVFKTDMAVIYVQNPVGGDGYFMCVAPQVFYDLSRATKRSLGIYIPFLFTHYIQDAFQRFFASKNQSSGSNVFSQMFQKITFIYFIHCPAGKQKPAIASLLFYPLPPNSSPDAEGSIPPPLTIL